MVHNMQANRHVQMTREASFSPLVNGINGIYHWSPMQKGKSQPEGKWIMPEMRFTEFPALSVDPRFEISRSAAEIDV